MNRTLTIGLVAQGNRSWVGGVELTKNLVVATAAYCRREGIPVRFRLFTSDHSRVAAMTSGFEGIDDVKWVALPDISSNLFRKVWVKARNAFLPSLMDLDLQPLIAEHEIDFLYPQAFPTPGQKCRSAAWIFDFQHKHLPESFSQEELNLRDRTFQQIAEKAQLVVMSSENARGDFNRLYPDQATKSRVLPFGVHVPDIWFDADPASIRLKYRLPEKYFIVCNQFWTHKNHLTLFDALEQAVKENPQLVIALTGHVGDERNPGYIDSVLAKIQQAGLHAHLRLLGLVPKSDQIQLLRGAHAVIQPSLFEGWSTIVEEAALLGKKILLSDLGVHREQAPRHARYFPPRSAADLSRLMLEEWEASAASRDAEAAAQAEYAEKFMKFGETFYRLATAAAQV